MAWLPCLMDCNSTMSPVLKATQKSFLTVGGPSLTFNVLSPNVRQCNLGAYIEGYLKHAAMIPIVPTIEKLINTILKQSA